MVFTSNFDSNRGGLQLVPEELARGYGLNVHMEVLGSSLLAWEASPGEITPNFWLPLVLGKCVCAGLGAATLSPLNILPSASVFYGWLILRVGLMVLDS